ncbi:MULTISPECIES: lanthionine synthetase C family protein [Parabacteroides]|uniref:lanthionine synthetase C family protein n=1 Tax=Parabacteroides provencensis TaxID=1944636 RepID=UPI000C15F49C|nr:lanthionine synthetase C family protein [Parabacteroides provencensis]
MKKLWKLPNNDLKKRVEIKLRDIVEYLVNIENKDKYPPCLMSGNMGIAIFLFYYARYTQNEYYAEQAMFFLESSINTINGNFNPSFCNGISGICWGIQHLIANQFLENDSTDILKSFDTNLSTHVITYASLNYFDYLHGAIGIAIYLLKKINSNNIRACENKIIDILSSSKININNKGCYWESKIGEKINISLSHGLASICIFLAKAYQLNINSSKTKDLLNKSITFLLSQEIQIPNRISIFPSFSLYEDHYHSSRLGWCYGDLGIALALWHYANIFKDSNIKQKAIEIFLFSALRKNLHSTAVIDGSICHGSAGIALIFKKMYYYTQREEFREASTYWLSQTLKMSKYEDGIVGYKSNGEKNSIDFLNGITGIGMVLLSFLTNENSIWDECLLLS